MNALLPTGRRGEQFQLIDDLSWTHGHHTLQTGVNDRNNRISDSTIASGSIIGAYTFTDLTDFAMAASKVLALGVLLNNHSRCCPQHTHASILSASMDRTSGEHGET